MKNFLEVENQLPLNQTIKWEDQDGDNRTILLAFSLFSFLLISVQSIEEIQKAVQGIELLLSKY